MPAPRKNKIKPDPKIKRQNHVSKLDPGKFPTIYDDEQRRSACAIYQILGSLKKVSDQTGICPRTLSDWKNSEWWAEYAEHIKQETNDEIVAGYSRIILKTMDIVEDRLDNGDAKVVKVGTGYEIVQVPIAGKDAALIGAIGTDKRQILLHQPTSISGKEDSMADLMQQFQKIARESREKIIEGEVVSTQSGKKDAQSRVRKTGQGKE